MLSDPLRFQRQPQALVATAHLLVTLEVDPRIRPTQLVTNSTPPLLPSDCEAEVKHADAGVPSTRVDVVLQVAKPILREPPATAARGRF